MPKTRFAKYTLTKEPAIAQMLLGERVAALRKGLAIVEARLAGVPADDGARQAWQRKRDEFARLLALAERAARRVESSTTRRGGRR